MKDLEAEWQRAGGTLSDKTARSEFGLTEAEIIRAIREGQLHCRRGSVYGNPFLRLLRQEVEALVKKEHGSAYLTNQKSKTELARIDGELKRLRAKVAALEARRAKLRGQVSGKVSR